MEKLSKKEIIKLYRLFFKYLKPYKWRLTVLLFLMVIGAVVTLANPYLVKVLIDDAILEHNEDLLLKIVILIIALNIIIVIVSFVSEYMYSWVSNYVVYDMRQNIFNHIIRLPVKFFKSNKVGDMVYRIDNELKIIQSALTATALRLVFNLLTLVGLIIFLIVLSPKLFYFICALTPFFLINMMIFHGKIKRITEKLRTQSANIVDFLFERFEKVKIIKVFNQYNTESLALDELQKELINCNLKSVVLSSAMKNIAVFFMLFAPVIVLGAGGYLTIKNALSLGSLIAYLQYVTRLFPPFKDLMNLYLELIRAAVSVKRVFEYLNIPSEQLENNGSAFKFKDSIKFTNINFQYDEHLVLDNLNLEIKKGQKIAIVGKNGCGKSTIIELLCRFIEPKQGEITIDGININDTNLVDLRENLTLVSQDSLLMKSSVFKNIKYGNPNLNEDQVKSFFKLVKLDDILGLKNNNTSIDSINDSTLLSNGQKQKVSVLRSLLRQSEVLLLDEFSSSIDSESEMSIFKTFIKNSDKTVILISHNLSILREVDEIYFIDNGKVVEKGNHKSMFKNKGKYWNLFQSNVSGQEAS